VIFLYILLGVIAVIAIAEGITVVVIMAAASIANEIEQAETKTEEAA
jgi:hypothetical protein